MRRIAERVTVTAAAVRNHSTYKHREHRDEELEDVTRRTSSLGHGRGRRERGRRWRGSRVCIAL